jgi:hypothetical protein
MITVFFCLLESEGHQFDRSHPTNIIIKRIVI